MFDLTASLCLFFSSKWTSQTHLESWSCSLSHLFTFIFCFFSSCILLVLVLLLFAHCVCVCLCVYVHPCVGTGVWLWFLCAPLPALLGHIIPSGEPVVPRGPQLSALSLRSYSCFSPAFSRCRPNPLAANGKPEHHRHLSARQLRHRRRGSWLRQPVSHPAVLPVHWVALQQVRPCPPPRGFPGPLSICRQHPEGSKVRKNKNLFNLSSALALFRSPFPLSQLTEGQIHPTQHESASITWRTLSFNSDKERVHSQSTNKSQTWTCDMVTP